MTISANYVFEPTVDAIVKQAYQRAGLLPLGRSVPPHEMSDLLAIMDTVLKHAQARGVRLVHEERLSQALTPGTASYPLGADTLNIIEPVTLLLADGASEVPVHIMSWREYASIPNKSAQGVPNRVFFERTAAFTMIVDPVPNAAYTVKYRRERLIRNADSGSTADLASRWVEWLVCEMAARIAEAKNQSTSVVTRFYGLAKVAWRDAKLAEADIGDVTFEVC